MRSTIAQGGLVQTSACINYYRRNALQDIIIVSFPGSIPPVHCTINAGKWSLGMRLGDAVAGTHRAGMDSTALQMRSLALLRREKEPMVGVKLRLYT